MNRAKIITGIFMALIIIVILALAVGVRLLMAGGEWSCVPSEDPALCAAVKESN